VTASRTPAPAAPQQPDAIDLVRDAATAALQDLAARLLENTPTARAGIDGARNATQALLRSLALVDFEVKRQATMAQRRKVAQSRSAE